MTNHQNTQCNIDIASLSRLSIRAHIYWKTIEGRYLGGNDLVIEKLGFSSLKDMLDKTDDQFLYPKAEAKQFKLEDRLVIDSGLPMKFYNEMTLPQSVIRFLTIKTPMFNQDKDIIGVFGFSQYIDEVDLNASLSLLSESGVKNLKNASMHRDYDMRHQNFGAAIEQHIIADSLKHFNLTRREQICLYHLARGKTAKETASLLFLSKRTVEKSTDRIKNKLDCTTKSELIDKAIEHGIFNFLVAKI